jgi:hypothetical protein
MAFTEQVQIGTDLKQPIQECIQYIQKEML